MRGLSCVGIGLWFWAGSVQAAVSFPPLEDEELAALEPLFSECAGRSLAAEQGARQPFSEDQATVVFDWHEESPNRRVRFAGLAIEDPATQEWQPRLLMLNGEQVLTAGDSPVGLIGRIDADEAVEVSDVVTRLWNEHTGGADLDMESIQSSRQPEAACSDETLLRFPETAEIRYQVIADSQALRPAPPAPSPFRGFVGAGGAQLSIWLSRSDAASTIQVREIECFGSSDSCDESLLAMLRTGITNPTDPRELEARRNAIVAALPPGYDEAAIRQIQHMMSPGQEVVIAGFERRPGTLTCSRPIDGESEWNCSFSSPTALPTLE